MILRVGIWGVEKLVKLEIIVISLYKRVSGRITDIVVFRVC